MRNNNHQQPTVNQQLLVSIYVRPYTRNQVERFQDETDLNAIK